MSMDGQWAILTSLKSTAKHPPIFVRCEFRSDSYSVFITDLAHVWTESLTRREIIRTALNDNTSIDPSEDSSQLRLLLETISTPLKGESGLTELASSSNGGVVLRATCKLPAPLHALSWTFHLSLASDYSLRNDVIAPLWLQLYHEDRQISDLAKLLQEKDHVINKLLDQLESLNADISTLFPSTAGLKGTKSSSKREQAGNLVPGLGKFREQEWRDGFSKRHPDIPQSKPSHQIALKTDNVSCFEEIRKDDKADAIGKWWEKLGSLPPQASLPESCESDVSRVEETQLPERSAPINNDSETETEDEEESNDFQRQKTPPQVKAAPQDQPVDDPKPPTPAALSPAKPSSQNGEHKATGRKLGRIGSKAVNADVGSVVADSAQVESLKGTQAESNSKPVRKLGRIGGAKDSSLTQAADKGIPGTASDEPERQVSSAVTNTARNEASNPKVGHSEDVEMQEVEEEETEEQKAAKADKKRSDLKRSLERQAPAKKKRRF